ncbi:MAG TPA: DinB family protein [Bacteroidia bacterium]|nr:DinB family protein [Bacteroidia bacterium]
MMKDAKEFLLAQARYNLWADKRIADVFSRMSEESFLRETKSSFPTIRKTAFHIWDAEHIWLQRLKGVSPADWNSRSLPADADPRMFVKGAEDFLAFLEMQDESFFTASTSFKDMKGNPYTMQNAQMIFHCMNHGTFHRGQLVTMIRESGWTEKLPSTDMITYFREVNGMP